MNRSTPAIAPLFRSEQQLRILAVLFTDAEEELTIGALAERANVAQATASRETARLAEHGLVATRAIGRNTLVKANWQLPWAKELRALLMQTVGPLGQIANALGDVAGVEEAFVFGSWAAQYTGEPGLPPRDIDVLVIGDATLRDVRRACTKAERELRVEVNPVVVDRSRWTARKPEPFVTQIQRQPLVPIPLKRP